MAPPTLQSYEPANRLARSLSAALTVIGAAVAAAVGCGSKPAFEFDTLDLTPVQEELAEYSLGKYKIPIPATAKRNGENRSQRNRLEFTFKLHALVEPTQKAQLADVWKRHKGKIRDEVIRVCRNTSLDDLQETELATLKSHLLEALQSQLATPGVRRLLITDVSTKSL